MRISDRSSDVCSSDLQEKKGNEGNPDQEVEQHGTADDGDARPDRDPATGCKVFAALPEASEDGLVVMLGLLRIADAIGEIFREIHAPRAAGDRKSTRLNSSH